MRSRRCAKAFWLRNHVSDDEWPDYDGEGDEDSLPPQQGDDEGEVGLPELKAELLRRLPTDPYVQRYVAEAMLWIDEQQSTEVMLAATDLLESNLKGHSLDDLREALREEDGEDLLYALLRLVKELKNA